MQYNQNETSQKAQRQDSKNRRFTLPAKYYTCPDYFSKEVRVLFFEQWICVGRSEQIKQPGQYFLREIIGESLIITRDEAHKPHCFFNVCRHRGTRMCDKPEGSFPSRISCPYHAWNYTLTGELCGAPHMSEVPHFSLKDYPLHEAAIEEWDGHLWVYLSKNPTSLKTQLEGIESKFKNWDPQELMLGKRIVYEVKANWKLIIQNYSECLHCPVIHPGLKKLTHYMSGDNDPFCSRFTGGSMSLNDDVLSMTVDGKTPRKIFSGLDEKQKRHVYYYWLNPNLLLSFHPDYLMTHTLWPKAPDHTEVICEWHFHPDTFANGVGFEDAFGFWDEVNREDWHVSELSQLGISSVSYQPGPYSYREGLLYSLDQILTQKVEGRTNYES